MKLISKIEFEELIDIDSVSDSEFRLRNRKYRNFLKQSLIPVMFVPCDNDGNVLKEPNFIYKEKDLQRFKGVELEIALDVNSRVLRFQEAQSKVIFEGFNIRKQSTYAVVFNKDGDIWVTWNESETIEALIYLNLDLVISF